uniref:Uncharacterized protein n=1 Tax=Nelumbo nucifera TaxID=4432 RepID=A0A822Z7C9_NELNU|nr:TPA_asm: hypothetical protein HUJ06_013904 [Nelumbo nucifera]
MCTITMHYGPIGIDENINNLTQKPTISPPPCLCYLRRQTHKYFHIHEKEYTIMKKTYMRMKKEKVSTDRGENWATAKFGFFFL